MTICVIPAAGQATRLRPLSNTMSKAMVVVNGRPIIDYIVGDNRDKFREFRVVVSPRNHDIKTYLSSRYPNLNIKYYEQLEMNGPAGAIAVALDDAATSTEPVVVWLGDTIFKGLLKSVPGQISVHTATVPDFERWCMIDDDGVIYDKVTTRPPTDQALIGVYEFPSHHELIDAIHKTENASWVRANAEWQISELIEAHSCKVVPYNTSEWYDCGEFQTLYESTARLMSQNTCPDNRIDVNIQECSITKSGERVVHEVHWYKTACATKSVVPYIPAIYELSDNSYKMEYCSGQNLQDVFAFENLNEDVINYVIGRVFSAYDSAFVSNVTPITADFNNEMLFYQKAIKRLGEYRNKYSFITYDMYENCLSYIHAVSSSYKFDFSLNRYFLHGDYHFGNILFDFQMGKLKMIDPRGSAYLSVMYDMTKLYQSIYGDYVWIKNGVPVNQRVKALTLAAMDREFETVFGCKPNFPKAMVPIFLVSILEFQPGLEEQLFMKGYEMMGYK